MRITQGRLINNVLYDLRQAGERLQKTEEQLSTLKVINRPSDDPVGTVTALRLRGSMTDIDRYISNIEDAQGWLDTTEAAFTSLSSVLTSAKSLATQANSDTLTEESRDAIAQQLDALIRDAIDAANDEYQGKSIFGGHKTTEDPATYTTSGDYVDSVTLTDDTGSITRQIGTASSMEINYNAEEVFGQAGDTLFDDLIALREAVQSGDTAMISSLETQLESHGDRILGLRTEVGAKMNRLSTDADRFESRKIMLDDLRSQIEDTDVGEASIYWEAATAAYEATLSVGAKIIMPTLLDFLE